MRLILRLLGKAYAAHKDERGVVALTVALSSVALFGFVALVMDGGVMLETRRQLQNGVDGAALAGGWELPGDPSSAAARAREYAAHNGILSSEITEVNVTSIFNPNDGLQVRAQRPVELGFARILGFESVLVGASATAIVAQVPPEDIWPWGVPESQVNEGYAVLKYGAVGDRSSPGNFGPLDFPPGGGSSSYEDNIRNGWEDTGGSMPPYDPPNPYSWWIDPKTGNMIGATRSGVDYLLEASALYDQPSWLLADPENYDPLNPPAGFNPHVDGYRIGIIPVISDASWDAAKGKSLPVEIVRYATFYLAGYTGAGGHMQVYGAFLSNAKGMGKANIGAPLKGIITARLWR